MKLKLTLSILTLLFTFNSFSQEKKLYNQKTKGLEAHPVGELKKVASKLDELTKLGEKSKDKKTKGIYLIQFYKTKSKKTEIKVPRIYYLNEDENKEKVKKHLKEIYPRQFIGFKNTNADNEKPYGFIVKTSKKNGIIKYGTKNFTDEDARTKGRDEVPSSGMGGDIKKCLKNKDYSLN